MDQDRHRDADGLEQRAFQVGDDRFDDRLDLVAELEGTAGGRFGAILALVGSASSVTSGRKSAQDRNHRARSGPAPGGHDRVDGRPANPLTAPAPERGTGAVRCPVPGSGPRTRYGVPPVAVRPVHVDGHG